MKKFLSCFLLFFIALTTHAAPVLPCDQPPTVIDSPEEAKFLKLKFCLSRGVPAYSLDAGARTIIEWSKLGLELEKKTSLDQKFKIRSLKRRSFDQTWEQVWGEERRIRNRYNELKIELEQRVDGERRRMNLVFRVFPDGIGFRYEIPRQKHLNKFSIKEELTEFNLSKDHEAWWIDGHSDSDYEQVYKKIPVSKFSTAMTPLTIEAEGLYLSIHEASLVDYAGMAIKSEGGGGRLRATLFPWAEGPAVYAEAPMKSPWRTIQVAVSPEKLIESYLVLNLNEPNRIKDTSWIRPGKFIGIWRAMHLGIYTWGSGPKHGATNANTRRYIDFARKLGIPGVLVEGWNLGWDGNWLKAGEKFSFTQSCPDFNLAELAAYAKSQGVELIGHHETAGAVANYEQQVDAAFDLYQKHGIHQVKTGYVARRIDGKEWRQGQKMVRHQQLITEKAAARQIMLNAHETVKDTGLRRTYPNLMTREGACGGEYDKGGEHGHNPPDHVTILPFTRGLSGPFDYTPGIFQIETGKSPGDTVRTTLARQLALFVVIYSPLHMAADLPENYIDAPPFQFIRDVPTDWETTRALNGKIGEFVTIARKDRHSQDWYLGAVTNADARDLSIPLSFLDEGKIYRAKIYADAENTHYLKNPAGYLIREVDVTKNEIFKIKLAAGGGQAVRFSPKTAP